MALSGRTASRCASCHATSSRSAACHAALPHGVARWLLCKQVPQDGRFGSPGAPSARMRPRRAVYSMCQCTGPHGRRPSLVPGAQGPMGRNCTLSLPPQFPSTRADPSLAPLGSPQAQALHRGRQVRHHGPGPVGGPRVPGAVGWVHATQAATRTRRRLLRRPRRVRRTDARRGHPHPGWGAVAAAGPGSRGRPRPRLPRTRARTCCQADERPGCAPGRRWRTVGRAAPQRRAALWSPRHPTRAPDRRHPSPPLHCRRGPLPCRYPGLGYFVMAQPRLSSQPHCRGEFVPALAWDERA